MVQDSTIKIPDNNVSKGNQASARAPDGRTAVQKAQHDASLLRLKAREASQMALVDVDDILAGIAAGRTQAELAKANNLNPSTLSIFLNSQTGDLAKRIASARKAAGDALADRAIEALEAADETLSGSVQLAGLKAKHWQWRASVSDRSRFAERPTPEAQAPSGANIPSFSIQILNTPNNQTVTIQPADQGESLI